jgi:hypothetical protein
VKGLYSLLTFADVVDSIWPVLKACFAGLGQLQLHTQLGQQQVSLKTDGRFYGFSTRVALTEQQAVGTAYGSAAAVPWLAHASV